MVWAEDAALLGLEWGRPGTPGPCTALLRTGEVSATDERWGTFTVFTTVLKFGNSLWLNIYCQNEKRGWRNVIVAYNRWKSSHIVDITLILCR